MKRWIVTAPEGMIEEAEDFLEESGCVPTRRSFSAFGGSHMIYPVEGPEDLDGRDRHDDIRVSPNREVNAI